jgi:hypothetical protein
MIEIYRRKRHSDVWHFCSNCRNWPKSNYESTKEKPKARELCEQCKAKRFNNNCK